MAKFIENERSNGIGMKEATEVTANLPIGTMLGVSLGTAIVWRVGTVVVDKTVDAFGTKNEDGKPIVIGTDPATGGDISVPTAEKAVKAGDKLIADGKRMKEIGKKVQDGAEKKKDIEKAKKEADKEDKDNK